MISALLLLASPSQSLAFEAIFAPGEPFSFALERDQFSAKILAQKKGSTWEISVEAKDQGRDLIGADARFPRERYRQVLDGAYSHPSQEPDGRVKVVQDKVAKAIRFYWGFSREISGEVKQGWMELPPLPVISFESLRPQAKGKEVAPLKQWLIPTQDRDDRAKGFRVEKRPYHWSGTDGQAWVITFGSEMAWQSKDIKLVFPEGGAWVPGYQLSRQHLVQFEFIETWGGGAKGCYEPMSDRVNRFSKVELVSDRKDRKVLRWTYQLINPDYIRWGEAAGSKQLPEVEEIWTIFSDGTAVRRQRYWAPLDTALPQHDLGCQVAELDVVWASDTLPQDVTPSQAATVFTDGRFFSVDFPSQRKEHDPKFADESVFGVAVHSLDPELPDVYAVFDKRGSLNPPYQLSTDGGPDWHREKLWRFSHFPFNLEPFQYETNSQTEGRGQISHTSLVYVGAPADRHWESQWMIDPRGRKYREWVTTVGLAPKRDFAKMLA
nr:hypothetical protein [Fimbriimonadaceae bacterium]